MEWGGEFRGRAGSTSFRTWPESIGLGGCDRRPAWCGSRSDWGGFWGLGSLPTARSRPSTVFPSMSVSRPEPIESGSFGMRRPVVSGGIGASHGLAGPRPTSRTSSGKGSGVGGWATAGTGRPSLGKAWLSGHPPNGWDFLADPDRHPPTDLGSGLPHLPESPPSHPGRLPQPSGGSRALAIESLGDILKNAHTGFASCILHPFLGGDQLVTDGRSPRLYSMTNHRVTVSWKASDWEKGSVFRT